MKEPNPRFAFDNSMLSAYKRCPRYYYYRHIEGLESTGQSFEQDFKAQFGVAWHHAMDSWFEHHSPEKMNNKFIQHWLPFEGIDPTGLRTMERGLGLLEHYRNLYPIQKEPFEVVHIEVGFAVEIGNFIYCGRVDKIARWKHGFEGLVIIDHKTSAAKGFLTLKPNSALDGYIYGCSEIISEPIIGALLDQVYLYKTKKEMIRELTTRKPAEIEIWKREVVAWMTLASKDTIYARQTNACRDFGRQCEFTILCQNLHKGTEKIQSLIDDLFTINHWSPYPEDEITERK